jgi:hypothetical protein
MAAKLSSVSKALQTAMITNASTGQWQNPDVIALSSDQGAVISVKSGAG